MQTESKTNMDSATAIIRWGGTLGAVLALVILGASIVLRLTSRLEADGAVLSLLPGDVERAIRGVHRVSAAVAGLLAIALGFAGFKLRSSLPWVFKAVMVVAAMTVLLAVVGPLTPGYRYDSVTVINVLGGTVLMAAYWWARESFRVGPGSWKLTPWALWTLYAWTLHIALGAAASAQVMHGGHWVSYVHSCSAMFAALMLGALIKDTWSVAGCVILGRLLGVLLMLQMVLGISALWMDVPAPVLGVAHALLSALLVLGLVSLSIRGRSAP